ncbi:wax ester/triacylglycerol synthase family O-acyltransferase [Streptomyces pathocidini]|uniref:Diacylglycerol O-acyltransferase n=1 Tax=Streptomyces pathocidini TaxID=1650571 RepID=A0ABW7UVA1_9ACTN|nr:wax ester/triacylglycerol synthase family O-acyltransferase [Streptomyces pathocidini]
MRVEAGSRTFLAYDSAATAQHVGAIATFALPDGAGPGYLQELFSELSAAPAAAAPFTFRPVGARLGAATAAWRVLAAHEIDLGHHVRRSALPRPGGPRELDALVSRLHSQPLDPARPLWEFHLIEGLADHRFAFYFKVHHALMDGAGLLLRLLRMLDPAPTDAVRPFWATANEPSAYGLSAGEPGGGEPSAGEPGAGEPSGGGAPTAADVARAARRLAAEARGERDPALALPYAVPRSMLNRRIGRQRVVATLSCELEQLRSAARAAGVTVNEILLAACGGGLRRYLRERGALPERTLTAGTPVSTRAPGDSTHLISITMAAMSLGTDVADPVERVRLVARSSALAKERAHGLPQGLATVYGAAFSVPFVTQHVLGLGGRTRTPYSVVVSNVAGPPEPRYLRGARLESLSAAGSICHGMALFIAAVSAGGRFSVVFTGDRGTVPRVHDLARYTGDALAELADALGRAPNPAPARGS